MPSYKSLKRLCAGTLVPLRKAWKEDTMPRPTVAYAELSALRHNYRSLRKYVPRAGIMAMVKADAYGHGILPVAKVLAAEGADFFGVATPEEGMLLRAEGLFTPILCVGAAFSGAAEAIKNQISLTVFNEESLLEMKEQLPPGHIARVHLKLETGMNRLGLRGKEELLHILSLCDRPDIFVEGIFTHFATSDCADKAFTHRQASLFMQGAELAEKYLNRTIIKHAACTGALIDCPEYHFDMVRPGIALYGYYPSKEVARPLDLQPVLRWETRISQVREAEAGETVGYGRAGSFSAPGKIAVLPVGYGDGYRRNLAGKGYVLIDGKMAPLLGRPCMDQIMVDVTNIPAARPGALVTLLGRQGDAHIYADEMADLLGTISYEVTLGITKRVPKEYCGLRDET